MVDEEVFRRRGEEVGGVVAVENSPYLRAAFVKGDPVFLGIIEVSVPVADISKIFVDGLTCPCRPQALIHLDWVVREFRTSDCTL